MATRILGPTGSKRRKRFLLGPLLLVAALAALLLAGSAQAVHELGFQLDGNVAHSCPPAPDTGFCTTNQKDWADLFAVTNPTATTEKVSPDASVVNATGPFTNATFTRDFQSGSSCALDSTSTTFCTGDSTTFATGSKDTLDISGWACNHDNNVNSKIDIMNAYSAAYTNPADGHKILYFGMEKNKNNGTNDVGFWFLQGDANCTAPTGTHPSWTGTHTVGDVLVVSEFTSGGGVSNIFAYKWVGGSNPLVQIAAASGAGGDCKTALAGDSICATTNSGTHQFNTNITTPWLTSDATLGVGHTVVPPNFFEGGIDLTSAFGTSTVPSCFSTFIGDTRSSTSLTATLFDYARGQLGQCNTTLTTQQNNATSPSIGTGTVSSGTDTATLNVTGTSSWGGTLTWYLCGPGSTTCDSHGVQVTSTGVSSSDSSHVYTSGTAVLTSAGDYCWHAHFEPNTASKNAGVKAADDDGTGECFTVTAVTPTLTTSATCTNTPCVLGTDTLSDTATLAGTATEPGTGGPGGDTGLYKSIYLTTPTGLTPADNSISWTLYGPSNSSCTTNSKLTTSRTVSGDGTYPKTAAPDNQTPVSYKPVLADGVGTYVFLASYPGDGVNTNAATSTTCSDSNEAVTLIGSAGSSSAQRWLPNDRVVLTTTGGTLNGSLSITLYSGTFTVTNGVCTPDATATAVPGQSYSPTVSGDASGTAYNTTNSTFFVGTKSDGTAGGAAGNYFWLIHYHDNNLTSPNDRCETSNLTITD
jgi:hypothetical protein